MATSPRLHPFPLPLPPPPFYRLVNATGACVSDPEVKLRESVERDGGNFKIYSEGVLVGVCERG